MLIGERFSDLDILYRYSIKRYISFKCRLPYQLITGIDVFKIDTDIKLSKSTIEKNRKIIYAITEEFVKNQAIPSKGDFVECKSLPSNYSFFITNIDIIIEIHEEESENIKKIFSREINNQEFESTVILQSALELFASKYNEALGGKDIFNPLAKECGAEICGYYERNKIDGEYISNNLIVGVGYIQKSTSKHKQENLQEIINKPYEIWKYFYNKAIYSYDKCKNLECILFAAIAIESYLSYLISINKLDDIFKEEKREKEKNSNNKNPVGLFFTTNFLKNQRIIDNNKKKLLNSVYGKISGYRNDIVHGKITTPLMSREIALKARDGLESIFEKEKKEDVHIEFEESFEEITSKMKSIMNYVHENKEINDIESINNMIDKNQFKDNCLMLRGNYFHKIGEYKKAIKDFDRCIINEFKLRESFYGRAMSYLSIGDYDKAMTDFEKLEEITDGEKEGEIGIGKGIIHYYRNDFNRSIEELKRIININDLDIIHYFLALNYIKLGEYESALEDINIAIKKNNTLTYTIIKVKILINKKDIIYAENILNQLCDNINDEKDNKTVSELYFLIGEHYFKRNKYQKAIELYTEAIKYNSKEKRYFQKRGISYKNIGDEINANKDFEIYKNI